MADIDLVIKIDEKYLEDIKKCVKDGDIDYEPWVAIANGTPLPKGHGRLIDADELAKEADEFELDDDIYMLIYEADIYNAPSIIEADEAGSEEE